MRAGLGFSYMSSSELRGDGGAGLTRLPVTGMTVQRPIYLVRHADKRLSAAMQAFLAEASTVLARSRGFAKVP